jgi:large subunit ribosomal protein L25
MDNVELEVQSRNKELKVSDLRSQNLIPAEYYGRGVENKSIQMDYQTFRRVYRTAGGNTIITLKVDGKEEINVLAHEVQLDPITDAYVHVDFANVRMGEALQTKVSLEFIGIAPAVKELAGVLTTATTEVEIKCLPKDLIHGIEVNIEGLTEFTDYIRVKDLIVPDTIEILNDPEDVVANVSAPREEVEEEPVPAEGVEGEEGEEGVEGEEGEGGEKSEGGEEKKEGGGDEGGEKKG